MPNPKRSEQGCLCCGCSSLRGEATIVSPFLAKQSWGGKPELTRVMFCDQCGFRFFDRGLSPDEANSYYSSYRDARYFKERNSFEPFYTEKVHRGIHDYLQSKGRRIALAQVLEEVGVSAAFSAALDFGGGAGHMLLDITAPRKAVFDLSDDEMEPGVSRITSPELVGRDWDLVLSCQVLEHVSDPLSVVNQIREMLLPGGSFYAEVPDEMWSNWACSGPVRNAFLAWLVKRPMCLTAGGVLSTGVRIKLGFLPPMAFVPMREHLNYFTTESLRRLLLRAGFSVPWAGKNRENCICAVGRR